MRLTPAGVLVAEHVRATLEDAERLSDRLRGLDGAVRGAVAVASAESAATAILPPLFAELHRAHPELHIRLHVGTPTELLGWLLDGQADLILTHDPPRHPDATVLASAAEPFCAVMRPGHSLAAERTVSLAACFAFPLVVATDNLAARTMFERLRALTPAQRPFALTTNLFEAMKRFVARSDATSFQFQIRPRGGIVADDLVSIPIEEQAVRDAHLYLACRTDRELPPAVAAVARRIEAVLLTSPA